MSTHVGIGELVRPLWPFTVNRDSPQAQGLMRWWPLGYFGAGNEKDLVAGHELTNTGSTQVVSPGYLQVARNFASDTQWLKSSYTPITGYPLSLAAHFVDGNDSQNRTILSINNGSSGTGAIEHSLRTDATSRVVVAATDNATQTEVTATTSTTIAVLTLGHALGVFSSATSRSAFLNGGGKATNTTSRAASGLTTVSVGAGSGDEIPYLGKLADIRLYNRALTDLEAASYFSDPRLSLDLYYPLGRRTWSFGKRAAAASQAPRSMHQYRQRRIMV